MKILVTGANGYIGSHVVKNLLNRGCQVIACDLNNDNIDKRAYYIKFDLFSLEGEEDVYKLLGSPDVCLHMAWRNGFIHNSDTQIDDLSNHFKFLKSLINGGLGHLSVMGTMHEIGYWEGAINENTPCNPTTMYGIAKDTLRKVMIYYCQQHNCVLQWLRGYYILGDDRRSNSIFGKILKANDAGYTTFPFTSGKNRYDFIKVEDLAIQISCTILQNKINGIINCCTGIPKSLSEEVEFFIKSNKLKIKLEYGAFLDRPYDSPCEYGDPSKIKEIMKVTNRQ